MPIRRYRYDGDCVVNVPDLHGQAVDPTGKAIDAAQLQPGQEFSTSVEIHNATFTNLDTNAPAVSGEPFDTTPAPEPVTEPAPEAAPVEAV